MGEKVCFPQHPMEPTPFGSQAQKHREGQGCQDAALTMPGAARGPAFLDSAADSETRAFPGAQTFPGVGKVGVGQTAPSFPELKYNGRDRREPMYTG